MRSRPARAIPRRTGRLVVASWGVAAATLIGFGTVGLSHAASAAADAPAPAPLAVAASADADAAAPVPQAFAERQAALQATLADAGAVSARLAAQGKFFRPTLGDIGSGWGMRLHPILKVLKMHEGVDVGAPCNAPVWAVLDGTVAATGYGSSSGNYIKVDHGIVNGRHLITESLHLNKISVAVGQRVARGEQIGLSGTTGLSTSCHVHLALWIDGVNSDPQPYLEA